MFSTQIPGAVEVLVSALVELHPFTVELFLDDEFVIAHFLDRILNLLGRPLAQHRRKRMEELDFLILQERVSTIFS